MMLSDQIFDTSKNECILGSNLRALRFLRVVLLSNIQFVSLPKIQLGSMFNAMSNFKIQGLYLQLPADIYARLEWRKLLFNTASHSTIHHNITSEFTRKSCVKSILGKARCL